VNDMALPGEKRTDALEAMLARQRRAFLDELPVTAEVRRDRLRRGMAMLTKHRERLVAALSEDFSSRSADWTLLAEIFSALIVYEAAEKSVERWMRPERRSSPMPFRLFGARAEIQYQPLGVVGIMSSWNGPVNLVLVPLATALAAGNRAMLCPSDQMPAVGRALDEAVSDFFDPAEVAVVHGGLEVSQAFSHLRFDHLMFTGSTRVGALVATAAAPNLVPVTLELGGKCPVIVGPDADLDETAHRLVGGKALNGGQACLGPDRLLVPREKLDELIRRMDQAARSLYPDTARNRDWCGLLDERQWQRVTSLVDEARERGARIVPLGVDPSDPGAIRDPSAYRMAIQLILDAPADTRAMTEEIFGPPMVVETYDPGDVDGVCRRLRALPKPLGLYVFAKDPAFRQYVLDRTFSGGVTLGDVIFHYSVPDLPFGGVGPSGQGAYSFGIEGFRRFSHARSVYTQAGPRALLGLFHPPYGRMFDWVVRGKIDKLGKRFAGVARPASAREKEGRAS